jgi:hypothetical protein
MDILFFSRGRGKGHAIPDAAIMESVRNLDDRIGWQFVSYGTGASTLAELGHSVRDLQLPDDNPFHETLIRACKVISECSPGLVVSHEEFAAVLAARIFGIPAIFLTDWFGTENHIIMQTLTYAESVIFLGERGSFDEPSYLTGKVTYVGPVVRNFKYHKNDRDRARQELGIPNDCTVVAVLPGGWANEQRAPIVDLLLPAFQALPRASKLLCWVAGDDLEFLSNRTRDMQNVLVLKKLWPIEQLMVASDLVITKGNRITIMETSSLGLPSISLSHGLNPVEEFIVPRIKSNLPLRVKGIDSEFLARCMDNVIDPCGGSLEPGLSVPGFNLVAEILASRVEKSHLSSKECADKSAVSSHPMSAA